MNRVKEWVLDKFMVTASRAGHWRIDGDRTEHNDPVTQNSSVTTVRIGISNGKLEVTTQCNIRRTITVTEGEGWVRNDRVMNVKYPVDRENIESLLGRFISDVDGYGTIRNIWKGYVDEYIYHMDGGYYTHMKPALELFGTIQEYVEENLRHITNKHFARSRMGMGDLYVTTVNKISDKAFEEIKSKALDMDVIVVQSKQGWRINGQDYEWYYRIAFFPMELENTKSIKDIVILCEEALVKESNTL